MIDVNFHFRPMSISIFGRKKCADRIIERLLKKNVVNEIAFFFYYNNKQELQAAHWIALQNVILYKNIN